MAESRRILIAQNDARSTRELVHALETAGHSVRTAVNGPAALEIAIATRPEVLVLDTELALIDGLRLAEILRVNPRTQEALILFLAPDPATVQPSVGYREDVLRKPCAPGDVATGIERLFVRAARARAISGGADGGGEGDLAQLPLPDLLQILHQNKRTGTVLLTGPRAARGLGQGFVYLKEGNPINALLGHVEGEKALFRLLAWNQGRFEFVPDQAITELRIRAPLQALLAESARHHAECEALRAELPGPDAELRLRAKVASLPPGVHPLTQEVLLLLEFHSRPEEIVDNCSAPDALVRRILHTLIRKGIVEVLEPRSGPGKTQPVSGKGLDPDQMGRLRARIAPGGLPESRRAHGNLLVFAPDGEVVDRLGAALAGLGGVTLPQDGESGGDPVPLLAHWQLSPGVALRILRGPLAPLLRPLWPLLGQGAVGVLFILDARTPSALDGLKPANDFFQGTQGLPAGYLIVSGEDSQAELKAALASRLGLKGSQAIYTIPRDAPPKMAAVLRTFVEQELLR